MKYIRIYEEPICQYFIILWHNKTKMSNNLQPVDFNHLDSIVNGDESFKKELIGIFLEQIPVFMKNMNKFLENNKPENLAREAHTAKSSVLIFGMTNAGALLKEIQLLAESKKIMEIQPILKLVETEFNNATEQLSGSLKKE
jgi:HPt (histidine-containing phosphotransfer) domain-containing protein